MTPPKGLISLLSLLGLLSVLFSIPLGAAAWNVDMCIGKDCSEVGLISVGTGSECITGGGGNSWALGVSDGCFFNSWSGVNCEGSSTVPTQVEGCYNVPFGSIKVDCRGTG